MEELLLVLLVLHPSDSSTIPFAPALVLKQAVVPILQALLRLQQELEVEVAVLAVVP